MQKHSFFTNILLHTDSELVQLLGRDIVKRETIHQWPLSCVQKLLLDDGENLIYKSQLPPTVEVAFYEGASSPLLPRHRVLEKLGDCDILTMEWIEAPLLCATAREEVDIVRHGRQVISQIAQIRGELSVYLDIDVPSAWWMVAERTFEKLRKLVIDKRFRSIDFSAIEQAETWTKSNKVADLVADDPRVIHGDLKTDQIFVTADGYRVIDWQRPIVAPLEVDLVSLLVGEGINPLPHVNSSVVKVFWFLRLHWAVEAQFNLLPDFRGQLFNQWALQALNQILV